MSYQYDQYLLEHKANVKKGFDWLCNNLPDLISNTKNLDWQITFNHDHSKNQVDEYIAYDAYFYGNNKSYHVVDEFKKAWLFHIHRNPHHWQYWVFFNDDAREGIVALDMSYNHIIEMICDWWSFGWKTGNLYEIFDWYEERKEYMILSEQTRIVVEFILKRIKDELESGQNAK